MARAMMPDHNPIAARHESRLAPPALAERPEPISIHFDLSERIAGRRLECQEILNELRSDEGRRILPIVAPAGFGKTSLVIKVLQQITDGERFIDLSMDAVLTVDCREGSLTLGRLFEELG